MENLTPEKQKELEDRRLFLLKKRKAKNNMKHKEKRKLECIPCEACGRCVDKYYYATHLKSARHKKNIEIQNQKKL
jgi:hypothetical protein